AAAAKTTGLPLDKVVVHNHLIGGGFGRRLEIDGVTRAVQIAMQVEGPAKAVWTREEDIQHDMYRPCFVDQMSAGLDDKGMPVAYRRALLDKTPRAKAVLELAAEKAGWGKPLPERVGRGVSVQFVFATYLAQVAEVEVSKDGAVRVRRVVCAVDCGTVVNPDTVRAQIQSGIIFGLTAALRGEITLKGGRVEQSNFHDYQMLRMNETPAIEVYIVKSGEAPGGMGETGTSAAAPALTNAIFAATATRIRKLPVANQAAFT